MGTKYKSIKEFLEDNQIFFQVATPIILMFITIMNISLSLSLTKKSIQDSRARSLPQFYVETDLIDENLDKKGDHLELSVYLIDGKASKIKVDNVVVLGAEVYSKTGLGIENSFHYPLLDFYLIKNSRDALERKMIKHFGGSHNWTYFSNLSDSILPEGEKKNLRIFLNLDQYVRIEYEDIYHSIHYSYYRSTTSQGYDFEEMSDREGKLIFDQYKDSLKVEDVKKRKFTDQFTTKAFLAQILQETKKR
jgi:hypothetical protein